MFQSLKGGFCNAEPKVRKERKEKKRTLSIVPDYVECVCGSGELSVVFY